LDCIREKEKIQRSEKPRHDDLTHTGFGAVKEKMISNIQDLELWNRENDLTRTGFGTVKEENDLTHTGFGTVKERKRPHTYRIWNSGTEKMISHIQDLEQKKEKIRTKCNTLTTKSEVCWGKQGAMTTTVRD